MFWNIWQAAPAVLAAVLILLIAVMPRHPPRWPMRWLRRILAGLAVVLAAASAALFYLLPIFELPTPDGPHAIGTRQFELFRLPRQAASIRIGSIVRA